MNELTLALPVVVPLQGATNLRDLGGYHTEDGRQVAHGKLFRSAALHRLTDADMVVLGGGLVEAMPNLIREEVRTGIENHTAEEPMKDLKVAIASLGYHAVTTGAAKLALDMFLSTLPLPQTAAKK